MGDDRFDLLYNGYDGTQIRRLNDQQIPLVLGIYQSRYPYEQWHVADDDWMITDIDGVWEAIAVNSTATRVVVGRMNGTVSEDRCIDLNMQRTLAAKWHRYIPEESNRLTLDENDDKLRRRIAVILTVILGLMSGMLAQKLTREPTHQHKESPTKKDR